MTHRRQKWVLIVGVLIALLLVGGYQLWVAVIQDRTETRIVRTTSTCAQVNRLYSSLVQLMLDDSTFSEQEVDAMETQRIDRLTVQGCKP